MKAYTYGGRCPPATNKSEKNQKKKKDTMKTNIRMRSVLFTLSALAFLGILGVSSQAGKPSWPPGPKPTPTVVLDGGIVGEGPAATIRVTFVDASFGEPLGPFIPNPDYSPALMVSGTGQQPKSLRFYYCDSPAHNGTQDLVCNDPDTHSPYYYKCLRIQGGIPQPKSNQIIFPEGSPWDISWKETMSDIAQGNLRTEVLYDVVK